MKYLIRVKGNKQKAHLWCEELSDTACGMWSTGGLKQSRFEQHDDRGEHEICHMCWIKRRLTMFYHQRIVS
jgi:hypothetical protein